MKKSIFVFLSTFTCFTSLCNPAFAEVGGISGSNSFTISGDGNVSTTTWKIVSFAVSQDAVYSGTVDTVSGDNITFASTTNDDNETVNPFFSSGCFAQTASVPKLTPTITGGSVSSISVSYGADGFPSNTGFSNAPEIVIDSPSGAGDRATATASLDGNGAITSITVTSGGSAYSSAPLAKVVGGPHLVRITDTSSAHAGLVFPIVTNTSTQLTLSFAREASGSDATDFFSAGTSIEIIPATTLGSFMGILASDLPANWQKATSAVPHTEADLVWIYKGPGYSAMYFWEGAGHDGWYGTRRADGGLQNNSIIFPDEGVILQKRTSGTCEFVVEGSLNTSNKKIYLPETGGQFVANNPLGMEVLLAELIPSTSIKPDGHADDATTFKSGASNTDTDADYITILDSNNSLWKTYWYKEGENDQVTAMMQAGAKAGTGGSYALTTSDLFIGSGQVTGLQTCTSAAGANPTTQGNDGNWTKVLLSGTAPATGFTITFSDVQGYMLSDDGKSEVNATTGDSIESNGTAASSVVLSGINGTHEVVGSGSGYVVIEKQRDVNFKTEGSRAWNVGTTGAGYTKSAYWWAVGGGGSGAKGTVTTSGSFTVTAGGSGYEFAPQIVISGGGWRYDDGSSQGGLVIGKNDGLIIIRDNQDGTKSYIEPTNPLD